MRAIPKIISVDDHVVEPPTLWQSRLPAKDRDRGPRVVRKRLQRVKRGRGGSYDEWTETEDGHWADVWLYDGLMMPMLVGFAGLGKEAKALECTTFDEILPGAWIQNDRLVDMDANHVDASLCFPNTVPRFCGQTFYENNDHDLGLLCVRAYNDWLFEEWGGGDGRGRLFGAAILPLWDPSLAAAEVRRCAGLGGVAVSFPESPAPLGLPSLHDKSRHWDPVFDACQETGSVVCMHIGSSSSMPTTSADAPFAISGVLTFQNAMGSLLDFMFSRTLDRFPDLRLSYSEAQVGWMPFLLERADKLWARTYTALPKPPSSYIAGRVYGCIFDDETGLALRHAVGIDQICFETDYPHLDSTFPKSRQVLTTLSEGAGLNDEEIYKLARGNAIEAFSLQRLGISS